ncbi:RHS repeat-associated core domain-containing protein [Streptomyces sp. NPDC045456]|uniref:RHS repeat-associated core domain-containing protein n=1 Tax=Streptomyces sp. NPDC045456 TaxID=3155254 RepID=UPI0034004B88
MTAEGAELPSNKPLRAAVTACASHCSRTTWPRLRPTMVEEPDGYQDPTGLYHFEARYYDPSVGRFTQPDPSGQGKHPYYLYAEGDPVNRTDPTGNLSLGGLDSLVGSWRQQRACATSGRPVFR